MCPECGEGKLILRSHESVETHGLDAGPHERTHDEWWECLGCGAIVTEADFRAVALAQCNSSEETPN